MAPSGRFPRLARRLLPSPWKLIKRGELVMMNFVLFAFGLLTAAYDTIVRV